VTEIESAKKAGEIEEFQASQLLESLGRAADASPDAKLKAFEAAIAEHTGPRFSMGSSGYVPNVDLPDLVTLVGEEKAEQLLRRALAARVSLSPKSDAEATTLLARRLATRSPELLAVPQWSLVKTADSVELFEAMVKRFPPKADDEDYLFKVARRYHIIGLILADRTDDALRAADEAGDDFDLPYDLGARLGRGVYEAPVRAFCTPT